MFSVRPEFQRERERPSMIFFLSPCQIFLVTSHHFLHFPNCVSWKVSRGERVPLHRHDPSLLHSEKEIATTDEPRRVQIVKEHRRVSKARLHNYGNLWGRRILQATHFFSPPGNSGGGTPFEKKQAFSHGRVGAKVAMTFIHHASKSVLVICLYKKL